MSPKTRIAILAVISALMSWTLFSVLLLLYGNDWWLSGLTTLTVIVWLAGLLVVIYQQGPVRAAATGAVIASATYWLLALGPWFSTNVGPTLLTSRLLARADLLLHGGVPQTQAVTWTSPTPVYPSGSPYAVSGSGVVTGQLSFSPQVTTIVSVPTLPSGSIFQSLGHWLLIWLVAAFGSCAAFFMQGRAQRRVKAVPARSDSSTVGESPFASVARSSAGEEKTASAGAIP